MRRSLSILTILLCGIVIGYAICWYTIRKNQPYQPVAEAKVCYRNLSNQPKDFNPELREYLKARLYIVSSQYIHEGWLDGWDIDFGPVNDSILTVSPITLHDKNGAIKR